MTLKNKSKTYVATCNYVRKFFTDLNFAGGDEVHLCAANDVASEKTFRAIFFEKYGVFFSSKA